MKTGDRVAYRAAFLKRIGTYTPSCRAWRGTVTKCWSVRGTHGASPERWVEGVNVRWDDRAETGSLCSNLRVVKPKA